MNPFEAQGVADRPAADRPDASGAGAFTDRVMAAIIREPVPTPARSFLSAVRRRSGRNAVSSLSVAWHIGTVRTSIAPAVRVRSIALVLGVACVLGTGSLAAAATVRVVAEPVVGRFFESGVDEQGPVQNQSPETTDRPATETPKPGVKQPSHNDDSSHDRPSGTDQPGGSNGDHHGPSGTDQPGGSNGDHHGPSGTDQPGGSNGGHRGRSGAGGPGGGESGGSSGPSGKSGPGNDGGQSGRSRTDQSGSN
jgi:hypothetical protein